MLCVMPMCRCEIVMAYMVMAYTVVAHACSINNCLYIAVDHSVIGQNFIGMSPPVRTAVL